MNVLAMGAHPDDLEILCGSRLALYPQQGCKVTMAVLTNGNMRHPEIQPSEMARIRCQKFANAAALIGLKQFGWM